MCDNNINNIDTKPFVLWINTTSASKLFSRGHIFLTSGYGLPGMPISSCMYECMSSWFKSFYPHKYDVKNYYFMEHTPDFLEEIVYHSSKFLS